MYNIVACPRTESAYSCEYRDVKPRLAATDVKPRVAIDIKPGFSSQASTSAAAANIPSGTATHLPVTSPCVQSPSAAEDENVGVSTLVDSTGDDGKHVLEKRNIGDRSLDHEEADDDNNTTIKIATKHDTEEVHNNDPPMACVYNCMHCRKSFKTRSALMNHLYSHPGNYDTPCYLTNICCHS